MAYKYQQYYYTSAPDLFNETRKNGFGIFGSSTPEDRKQNENAEQFAKELVPMPLSEQEAFPVEYVFYRLDRYMAGGAVKCSSLIESDNRPNIWAHIYVPEKTEEDSFYACLAVDGYDGVKKEEKRIVLKPCETEKAIFTGSKLLKAWEKAETRPYFLKMVLGVLCGKASPLLFVDKTIKENDYEQYRNLAKEVMRYIFTLVPGVFRKRLNYIAPMIPDYFAWQTDKPDGANFYFGTPGEGYQVISMDQASNLPVQNFMDSCLVKMTDVYDQNYDLYEEIGTNFLPDDFYMIQESDYIWHYVYMLLIKDNTELDWKKVTERDYKEAGRKIKRMEEYLKGFVIFTRKLLKRNTEITLSEKAFSICCLTLNSYVDEKKDKEAKELIDLIADWIITAEELKENQEEKYFSQLRKHGIKDEIISQVHNAVMKFSDRYRKKAERELNEITSVSMAESWYENYACLSEQFTEQLSKKYETLFHEGNENDKKEILKLDKISTGGKTRRHLKEEILEKCKVPYPYFYDLSTYYKRLYERWVPWKEDLYLLDAQCFEQQKQEWENKVPNLFKNQGSEIYWKYSEQLQKIAEILELPMEQILNSFLQLLEKELKEIQTAEGFNRQKEDIDDLAEPFRTEALSRYNQYRENFAEREKENYIKSLQSLDNQELIRGIKINLGEEQKLYIDAAMARVDHWEKLKSPIELELLLTLCYNKKRDYNQDMISVFWKLCEPVYFQELTDLLDTNNYFSNTDFIYSKGDASKISMTECEFRFYRAAVTDTMDRKLYELKKLLGKLEDKSLFKQWLMSQEWLEDLNPKIKNELFKALSQKSYHSFDKETEEENPLIALYYSAGFMGSIAAVYEVIWLIYKLSLASSLLLCAAVILASLFLILYPPRKRRIRINGNYKLSIRFLAGCFLWSACLEVFKIAVGDIGLGIMILILWLIYLAGIYYIASDKE